MKSNVSEFIAAVLESKVLNAQQKKELLDTPELLPEGYRMQITAVLRGYDQRARMREQTVRTRMEAALGQFEQALDAEHIPDEEKQTLLVKSRKHLDIVIQNTSMS